jgi:hypothetical protein
MMHAIAQQQALQQGEGHVGDPEFERERKEKRYVSSSGCGSEEAVVWGRGIGWCTSSQTTGRFWGLVVCCLQIQVAGRVPWRLKVDDVSPSIADLKDSADGEMKVHTAVVQNITRKKAVRPAPTTHCFTPSTLVAETQQMGMQPWKIWQRRTGLSKLTSPNTDCREQRFGSLYR